MTHVAPPMPVGTPTAPPVARPVAGMTTVVAPPAIARAPEPEVELVVVVCAVTKAVAEA